MNFYKIGKISLHFVLPCLISLIGLMTFFAYAHVSNNERSDNVKRTTHTNFSLGEQLTYRFRLGLFTIGKGVTKINKKVYRVRANPCYKVEVIGTTSGMVSWITPIKDLFYSYVDTTTLLSHLSYRKLREGKYRMDEQMTYDHANLQVSSMVLDQKEKNYKKPNIYALHPEARDIISGFLYIRTLDFSSLYRGDTISMNGFVEDTNYPFKIVYAGKEMIKTDWGRVACIKLIPIMPKNKIFDGNNAIVCWISDDKNRVPVKMKTRMYIANFVVELSSFRGLKYPFKITF